MKVIHKYQFIGTVVDVPAGEVLSVGVQNDAPVVWVQRDNGSDSNHAQRVHLFGTGMPFDDTGLTYVGTVQIKNELGVLVLHAFKGPLK